MSAKTANSKRPESVQKREVLGRGVQESPERASSSDPETIRDLVAGPMRLAPSNVAALQHTVGNRDTSHVIRSGNFPIQRQKPAGDTLPATNTNNALTIGLGQPFFDTITVGSTGAIFVNSLSIDSDLNPKGDQQIDYRWNVKLQDPDQSVTITQISKDSSNEASIVFKGLRPGSVTMTPVLDIKQKNRKPMHVEGKPLSITVVSVSLISADREYDQYLADYEKYAGKITELRGRKSKGENVGAEIEKEDSSEIKRYEGARQKAEEAATLALDVSKQKEIHDVISSLLSNIDQAIDEIQTARATGYEEAVNLLNAEELEKTADTNAFWIAFAGNLLWALSGSLPWATAGALAAMKFQKLKTFFSSVENAATHTSTIIGTVGAMTAQFSGGIPTAGPRKAGLKKELLEHFGDISSQVANHQKRISRQLLLEAMASAPPSAKTNPIEYVAELSVGLRYNLYGDIYKEGLNDGALPYPRKITSFARDQLLHQYVAGTSTISEGEVVPTYSTEQAGTNLVKHAINALGGQKALSFGPYELVENQLHKAASDLGVSISESALDHAISNLRAGTDYAVPISAPDKDKLAFLWASNVVRYRSNGLGRGIKRQSENWIYTDPSPKRPVDMEEAKRLASSALSEGIDRIWIVNKVLSRIEINGKAMYSAQRFFIGPANDTGGYTYEINA